MKFLRNNCLIIVFGLLCCCLLCSGCRQVSGSYFSNNHGSGELYSVDSELPFTDQNMIKRPIVFIHGLLGSELQDSDGRKVWGRFGLRDMASGRMFRRLALDIDPYSPAVFGELKPAGLLAHSEIPLGFFDAEIVNYRFIIDFLKKCGCSTDKSIRRNTLFVFYYDWRLSIAHNAARLADFLDKKKRLYADRGIGDIKFDLIGHSMGGLIARYYVQFGAAPLGQGQEPLPEISWAGAKNVRKVIQIASPNRGYADTLLEMLNGLYLTVWAPYCHGSVLATFPSYYQMMPAPELNAVKIDCQQPADIFDIELFRRYKWGLLDRSEATELLLKELMPAADEKYRQRAADIYTAKMLDQARRLKKMLAEKMIRKPYDLDFYLLAAVGEPTASELNIDSASGKVSRMATSNGDGKVAWTSAADPAVDFRSVCVLSGGHMGLMRSAFFAWNLSQILRQ